MRAPVRPISGAWPAGLEQRFKRFFRPDPKVLIEPDASPEAFSRAMSSIHVGETVKITERDRHPSADQMLIDHLDLNGKAIVDLGASDGSTSLDLIRKLPAFASYTIADLFLSVTAVQALGHVVVYDGSDDCILVAGRRLVAWPSLSSAVRILYSPIESAAAKHRERRQEVMLLNPELRALMTNDARITARVHDVFTPWPRPAPDVIKVANLLRKVYFSDEQLTQALEALHEGLDEGGHLLIVDDGTRYTTDADKGQGARAGLYRRDVDRFAVVVQTEAAPEIAHLVTGLRRQPPHLTSDNPVA